jgi:hopanoid biosynthesis associated RND transporter like protein HpnN
VIGRLGEGFGKAVVWWVAHVTRAAPWVVIVVLLVTGATLRYTVHHLKINTDTEAMFSPELPFRRAYDQYRDLFPQFVDTLLVVVDSDTPELARQAASRLADRLRRETRLVKTVYEPGAGPFFTRTGLLYLAPDQLRLMEDQLATVQPFMGQLAQGGGLAQLSAMLAMALETTDGGGGSNLTLLLDRFDRAVAADLHRRFYQLSWQEVMAGRPATALERRCFLVVQPRLNFSTLFAAGEAIPAVRRVAKELELTPAHGVRVRITGDIALSHEELETVSRGAEIAAAASLAMVAVVLFVGLRSVRLVVATLVSLVAGLILTGGFAAVAIGRLNLISVAFGVLYIGLGVDYAIHLCLRYAEVARSGGAPRDALVAACGDVSGALLLCTVSTAIGFYSFVPTAYAGVAELGWISGTGMFISLAVTLTLLPALLAVMGLSPRVVAPRAAPGRLAMAIMELPQRHGRAVRRGALALGLAAVALLPSVRFDYNPLHVRDPHAESVTTLVDLLTNSDTPPWTATVLAPDGATARRLATRLAGLPAVVRAVTVDDLVPDRQQEKLAVIADLEQSLGPLPVSAAAADPPEEAVAGLQALRDALERYGAAHDGAGGEAAWRLHRDLARLVDELHAAPPAVREERLDRLADALLGALPASLHALWDGLGAAPVGLADLPADLVARWVAPSGIHRVEVVPKEDLGDDAALRRFVTQVQGVAAAATDAPVLNLESGDAVVNSFRQACTWALVTITLVLWVLLRSLRETALVLAPLVLTGAWIGGAMVALGIPFNYANVIALPLLLGIGVDNGIHIVHRARRTAASHGNPLRSSTARAALFSAITTLCSFGSLSFSPHRGTASLGQVLTLGILFTLVSTLVVLPALLDTRLGGARHPPQQAGA